MAEAKPLTFSWIDRLFPWRIEQKTKLTRLDSALEGMQRTANGIRKDHKLDELMIDIERIRADGIEAMEAAHEEERQRHDDD